jgi:AAA15 family ATPase/GTPase/uncharacterized protein YeeX (DUF496 family)
MPKYVKLFNQFSDFLKNAKDLITDPYERKLANIILENFDDIADAGTAQGKRGWLLNSLIQKFKDTVSDSLPEFDDTTARATYSFKRIARIELEQFRGFTKKETIDFDKKYTFIYGPNGSGKSSFCEALEYSLLGYIDEAIHRRIDITQYIRNVFTGQVINPKLIGINIDEEEIEVNPDSGMFNFCFIEKNRIEEFGRISANTPSDRQNLLAALFGLSEFNDFIENFTKTIENYLDVYGKAGQKLKPLSAGIDVQRKNVETAQQGLASIEQIKNQIAESSGLGMAFAALEAFINGGNDKQGRLADLNSLLSAAVLSEIKIFNKEEIENIISGIGSDIGKSQSLYDEYIGNREKIQFRQLYAAAIELQNVSADNCPVCETPIDNATKNPFENAKTKLKELEQISILETQLQKNTSDLKNRIEALSTALHDRTNAAMSLGIDTTNLPAARIINLESFHSFPAMVTDFKSMLEKWDISKKHVFEIDNLAAKHNKEVREVTTERKKLEDERKKLSELSKTITTLNSQISTMQTQVTNWKGEIDNFTIKNSALIKEAQDEKTGVLENQKFATAYHNFLSKLILYRDNLPIRHLRELNSLTVELYNIINEGDKHYEKIEEIMLPSTTADSISIAFADKPEHKLDALHVLSEGHIRCLGLAILLAKNIHEKSPLVIFDDVVNAIDDDHRSGVRSVVFSTKYMDGKQIILTTHAELFVKELEQHPEKSEYEKFVQKLTFFIDEQERLIRIKHDAQQNYLCRIEKACKEAGWSDALYNSRCCLESLTNKLWVRLGKRFNTELSIVLRSPTGKPDLMNVVASLNKFLKKVDNNGEFKKICDILVYFLGLESANNIIWQYLNKGTHEEEGRNEFDHTIVAEIAKKLITLDSLVKSM